MPWGAAIIAGRVGIGTDGFAHYGVANIRGCSSGAIRAKKLRVRRGQGRGLGRGQGVEQRHWLEATGVSPGPSIKSNALVMVATSLAYLVMQGPAQAYATEVDQPTDGLNAAVSHVERWWSLGGLLLCLLSFAGYLFMRLQQAGSEESCNRVDSAIVKAVRGDRAVTLSGLVYPMIAGTVHVE